jgi:putative transposase
VTDDVDRARFVQLLDRAVTRRGWRCHSYCLLDNHYHLVVETPEPNISAGMHELNLGYAKWFNRRHDLNGHVFQNRFYGSLAESDSHFLELSRYVVLNPVRAGACPTASDWRWGSYRATAGLAAAPRFLTTTRLLSHFGNELGAARLAYAEFVREGLAIRRH